jgi:hypothetical protein
MIKILKPIAVVASAALLMLNPSTSKAQAFDEGIGFASLGYGFPNFAKTWLDLADYGFSDEASTSAIGPIHGRFEYGITEKLGIGVSVNFANAKRSWLYNTTNSSGTDVAYKESLSYNTINALIRINWHWVDHDKVDVYSGLGLGYNHVSFKYDTENPNNDASASEEELNTLFNFLPIGYEATVGMRYMFTENLGAYLEAGWSKSLFQFGVVYSFEN